MHSFTSHKNSISTQCYHPHFTDEEVEAGEATQFTQDCITSEWLRLGHRSCALNHRLLSALCPFYSAAEGRFTALLPSSSPTVFIVVLFDSRRSRKIL